MDLLRSAFFQLKTKRGALNAECCLVTVILVIFAVAGIRSISNVITTQFSHIDDVLAGTTSSPVGVVSWKPLPDKD